MCHIRNSAAPVCMSDLAQYQNALRPTITHRTSHLARLGLISRIGSHEDHRNICCELTQAGEDKLNSMLDLMIDSAHAWKPESDVDRKRIAHFIDNAGAVSLSSSELVLLAIFCNYCNETPRVTVGELSQKLGLLQPTVSMAVSALSSSNDIKRSNAASSYHPTSSAISLSSAGSERAEKIFSRIEAISVL